MKLLTPLILAAAMMLMAATCNKTANKTITNTQCFKGRLEIKGICMNYVIKVLQGDTKALSIDSSWTDESDGKVYRDVFALGNKCNFPDLQEGDEFYFTINGKEDPSCNVCMAFRPVPASKNNIVVSKTPCP
jgi:hypothetical protein